MFWISPGCLSGWFRLTVRNGGRRRGHTPENTASSPCQAGRILPDLGAFYGQNNGCGAGIFPVVHGRGIRHQGSPGRRKCLFWACFSGCHGAWLGFLWEIRTSAARSDFLIRKKGAVFDVGGRSALTLAATFYAGYRGAAALLGSRGNAHWRVKGGSPYRVKGETPCPARVGACANSYWVLPDASSAGSAAPQPSRQPGNR